MNRGRLLAFGLVAAASLSTIVGIGTCAAGTSTPTAKSSPAPIAAETATPTATAKPSPTHTPTPTPQPTPRVLVDAGGRPTASGSASNIDSPDFTATAGWDLHWAFTSCTGVGGVGVFNVYIVPPGKTIAERGWLPGLSLGPVVGNQGAQHFDAPGSWHLHVVSNCVWHAWVTA